MFIILSPAKNMNFIETTDRDLSLPCLMNKTKEIVKNIRVLSLNDIKDIMKTNEKLSVLNKDRFDNLKFDKLGSPAILTYDGIQYKNIDAKSFTKDEEEFANRCIRIISGLYGVLRPYDSIYEYRLEIKTKLQINNFKNLYEFWSDDIYRELLKDNKTIINLSSSEYSKSIEKFISPENTYITCNFKINKNGKLKIESTQAKKARGMMVNYIVKNRIEDSESLKKFDLDGYRYQEELSNVSEYVFIKD